MKKRVPQTAARVFSAVRKKEILAICDLLPYNKLNYYLLL